MRMRNKLWILGVLILMITTSCYDDKGNYSYRELFTVIARVVGKRPPRIRMAPWMTGLAWRLLAFVALFTGKKPAFTKETARSSQHKSRYSSAKVLSLFPDFHFHTLEETARFFKDL